MRFIRWISLLAVAGSLAIGLPTVQAAPLLQDTGQICVLAFSDINGDGVHTSPDEELIAGVTFWLSNETGRLGTYTTDGNSEPYCFGNLAVGQYTVQARPDPKKIKGEATTPGQWVVPLASGAEYDITYGVPADAQPEAGQVDTGSPSSGGMSPVGRIALAVLGIAVLGAAGYLAYTILRRARSA
jgi:hypothetical protein